MFTMQVLEFPPFTLACQLKNGWGGGVVALLSGAAVYSLCCDSGFDLVIRLT